MHEFLRPENGRCSATHLERREDRSLREKKEFTHGKETAPTVKKKEKTGFSDEWRLKKPERKRFSGHWLEFI